MSTATQIAPRTGAGAVAVPGPVVRERRPSVPVSRRQKKRRSVVLARTIACALGLVFLLGYIGLYAQVTLYGYRRAELTRQIRKAEMANQSLKADIQGLASPERIAGGALAIGMEPSTKSVYIPAQERVKVARAQ